MPARIPLDVDLEDKLLYGLSPMHMAYLLVALVAGFGLWSSHWIHVVVRGCAAAMVICAGALAAWGRWRGRAADDWAIDIAVFVVNNHRVSWRRGWPRSVLRPPPTGSDVAPDEPPTPIDAGPMAKAA